MPILSTRMAAFFERIKLYVFFAYLIALHLHTITPIASSICIGLLFITYLGTSTWQKTKSRFRAYPALWVFALFIVWYLISCFWVSENTHAAGRILAMQIPFFILPFLYAQLDFSPDQTRRIEKFFVVVVLCVALMELTYSAWRYVFIAPSINYFYTDQLTSLTRTHTTYFSMYLMIAFWFIVQRTSTQISYQKLFFARILPLVFISLLIYLLGSKIVMPFMLISWCVWFYILGKKILTLRQIIFSALGLIVLAALWVHFFSANLHRYRGLRWSSQFNYADTRSELDQREAYDSTRWTTISFRRALWTCAMEVYEKKWLTGVGVGDYTPSLMQVYEAKNFKRAIADKSYTHNTFLDIGIQTGLVGAILLFMALFALPFYRLFRARALLPCAFIVMFFLSFLVESYTARAHYLLLLSFVVSYWITFGKNRQIKTTYKIK